MIVLVICTVSLVACGGGGGGSSTNEPVAEEVSETEENTEEENIEEETTEEETNLPEAVVERVNLDTGTVREPAFAYYDIDTAAVLELTEVEAETNMEWDIAFRRTDIYLNSNAVPAVSLLFLENTDEFYDVNTGDPDVNRFTNATADSELSFFEDLTFSTTDSDVFNTDSEEAVISDFYIYDPTTNTVSANSERNFIVDSDAAYSKVRITELVQNGFGLDSMTLAISYQSLTDTAFGDEQTLLVESTQCSGGVYIDIDTNSVVDVDADWDLEVPCSEEGLLEVEINISEDALAINDQGIAQSDAIDPAAAAFLPWNSNSVAILAYMAYGDSRSGQGWGEYNLTDSNLLWPNFASYLIRTPEGLYKFQVTNYYNTETSASGSYSIRHQAVAE